MYCGELEKYILPHNDSKIQKADVDTKRAARTDQNSCTSNFFVGILKVCICFTVYKRYTHITKQFKQLEHDYVKTFNFPEPLYIRQNWFGS